MPLIINSPINIVTGKPSGQSWRSTMQTNHIQENHTMQQNSTIQPMMANGDAELRINRAPSHTKDGKVRPMPALGFKHNELGTQARWNRIQAQLQQNDQDVHDFHMLKEVYDDHIVYEVGNKLWKRGYTIDDNDQITLENEVTEVVESVTFDEIKIHGTQASTGVRPMPALGFAHNK